MNDTLFLAWKYLRYHWLKSTLLVLSIGLVLFIPAGLSELTERGSKTLTDRADQTPLLVGARGSETELCMSALYFKKPQMEKIPYYELDSLVEENLGIAIPMHMQYQVNEYRIIGTTTEYFKFRNLSIDKGRQMAMLGECVLGYEVARQMGLSIGESVISSPAGAFDVAGSYPLKMSVVGIMVPNGTADDEAIFVDIKTSWVIAGLAHGHENLSADTPDSLLLEREEGNLVASAAVLSYTEITAANRSTFHFHGDSRDFPIDAVIVVPPDQKSSLLLQGRYAERRDNIQMIVPSRVVGQLVDTIFSVRDLMMLAAMSIGLATLAIVILVFTLSLRLRKREIMTMRKIGAATGRIRHLLALEIVLVVLTGIVLAATLTWLLGQFGLSLVETFLT